MENKKFDVKNITEVQPEYKMDLYFSVFNCHLNNAQKRAKKLFIEKFSADIFKKEIQPFIKNGIMSIFQQKQNPHTLFFATAIMEFVNENRIDKPILETETF